LIRSERRRKPFFFRVSISGATGKYDAPFSSFFFLPPSLLCRRQRGPLFFSWKGGKETVSFFNTARTFPLFLLLRRPEDVQPFFLAGRLIAAFSIQSSISPVQVTGFRCRFHSFPTNKSASPPFFSQDLEPLPFNRFFFMMRLMISPFPLRKIPPSPLFQDVKWGTGLFRLSFFSGRMCDSLQSVSLFLFFLILFLTARDSRRDRLTAPSLSLPCLMD